MLKYQGSARFLCKYGSVESTVFASIQPHFCVSLNHDYCYQWHYRVRMSTVTHVSQRPLHQLMSLLTSSHRLYSTVKTSSKPYKYLYPLIVKRVHTHKQMQNALLVLFSKEMHSNRRYVFVTMTTEFSDSTKQDLAPSLCSDKRRMIAMEGKQWAHQACSISGVHVFVNSYLLRCHMHMCFMYREDTQQASLSS